MATVKFEKTSDPQVTAVGAASAACGTLVDGAQYYMVSTTACYVKLGVATPTASAASGSLYVAPNIPYPIAAQGAMNTLAAIQVSAGGTICVFRVG